MNLRKEVRKANLAKWQAQGPGIIERPLRLLKAHAPVFIYREAKRRADDGRGRSVTCMARDVLRGAA